MDRSNNKKETKKQIDKEIKKAIDNTVINGFKKAGIKIKKVED